MNKIRYTFGIIWSKKNQIEDQNIVSLQKYQLKL